MENQNDAGEGRSHREGEIYLNPYEKAVLYLLTQIEKFRPGAESSVMVNLTFPENVDGNILEVPDSSVQTQRYEGNVSVLQPDALYRKITGEIEERRLNQENSWGLFFLTGKLNKVSQDLNELRLLNPSPNDGIQGKMDKYSKYQDKLQGHITAIKGFSP